ncbi:hypothetical protein HPO_10170 [Hyphomonas polymorpha PS728]|uniref:DUF1150 domain-containing protein n=1 Tax=Hyphomonas polymorpha PS728 TaxID=1280954 RepID=A0A062V8Q6_9PROT|nr:MULTISPECIES: DUF1150 family protein [Hyphomonas]AXE65762.1 hypothetical protein BBF93_17130 [Hyphomonas sp. CACIAM 19H1]KCZ98571.1 hypothetical protein HPO_10170 [Hyphomonas polymorpha PS728]
MTTEIKTDLFEKEALVYIRHMDVGEISGLLPPDALADIDDPEDLFMVFSADGQRLAIVEGRDAAFAACHANDLHPLSVH